MQEQNRHIEAHGASNPPAPASPASFADRIARMRTLVGRGLAYWKGAGLILLLAGAAALGVATHMKRVYRSECTIFVKPRIRTDDREEASSPEQVARQGARLKDMLTTRSRLESAIKKFGLYKDTVASKTMLDAAEQMKPHVGFRSLEGGQFIISFDGDDPDTVQHVTEYLSESLIDDYASADLQDLRREADFLASEEQRSLHGLEDATRELTLFLAAHPEFAVEAKQAATPFGPSPAAGIPLMPKLPKDRESEAATDPQLAALFRERARLEGEIRTASGSRTNLPVTASAKQLDDQIAQAQAQVEAAAKRVAETQSDLASKSNLTEDHPDMRAARMYADAAARQLHEAKAQLAGLQQMKATGASADRSPVPPDFAEKLRQIDAQIAARREQASKAQSSAAAGAQPSAGVTAVVELETEWQRLLRAMNEAKSHHDDLKLRAERAKLGVEAARAEATERISVVDPPYRPTHPSKGGRTNAAIGGLLLAFLFAAAYATARVTFNDTLVDSDDIEGLGVVPVLGVVPRLDRSGRSSKSVEAGAHASL